MRVAIASSGLGHVARGIEAWAHDLAYALHERGVEVRLYKGGGRQETPIERVVPCVRRGSLPARLLSGGLATRALWRLRLGGGYAIEQNTFARKLIPRLRRDRIDLLHVQDPLLALLVQEANRSGRIATRVVLGHGTEEPNDFLAKIDCVQHLAPWRLEQCRREGCYQPSWTAIPNFIDTDLFHPEGPDLRGELDLPASATVVLCVAAIKRGHKRIDYLLDEFEEASRRSTRDLRLVVAGGGEAETDELVSHGERRLGDRVRFLVSFPRQRMPSLYRTADLFTLASLNEMMPIALLEAAASGLACVTHGHPVMRWMVGPGGVSMDMERSGALADALEGLTTEAEASRRLGEAAREQAVAEFSEQAVLNQILAYYDSVLEDRPNHHAESSSRADATSSREPEPTVEVHDG